MRQAGCCFRLAMTRLAMFVWWCEQSVEFVWWGRQTNEFHSAACSPTLSKAVCSTFTRATTHKVGKHLQFALAASEAIPSLYIYHGEK